ncbi:MAG TPA: hypothetical protein VFS36_03065 [Chitinophagaceae bacterium]|nr:hypothetical protein [Chitinophagaceae bacterium]
MKSATHLHKVAVRTKEQFFEKAIASSITIITSAFHFVTGCD